MIRAYSQSVEYQDAKTDEQEFNPSHLLPSELEEKLGTDFQELIIKSGMLRARQSKKSPVYH